MRQNARMCIIKHWTDSLCEPCCSGDVEGPSHSQAQDKTNGADADQPALPMQSTLGQWLRTCATATDLEVASMLSVAPSMASTTEGPHAAPGTDQAPPCRCSILLLIHTLGSLVFVQNRLMSGGCACYYILSSLPGTCCSSQPQERYITMSHFHAGSQCSAARKAEHIAEDVGVRTIVVPPVKVLGTSGDIAARSLGEAETAQWTPRSCKAFRSSEGTIRIGSGDLSQECT